MKTDKEKIKAKWRAFKINKSPKIITFNKKSYVRVVRLADEGFNIKPYKSFNGNGILKEEDFAHNGFFYNVQIEGEYGEQINDLPLEQLIIPDTNENLMEGCFCYLYEFDLSESKKRSSVLGFRHNHKVNIGYLPIEEVVWVSNIRANLKGKYVAGMHDSILERSPCNYDWVKMTVINMIERSKSYLWSHSKVEESISQIYLTEEQKMKLKFVW
ncbi:hypothetical protein [Bacillus sp. 1P06AnD]|uniref:hypothetical protein n=1 Tax=Bacillus sp. 1P06AnD TaxID=3132208 RepID=UPI0039A0BCD6